MLRNHKVQNAICRQLLNYPPANTPTNKGTQMLLKKALTAATVVLFTVGLTACSTSADPSESAAPSNTADACAVENLQTLEAGVITIGTDSPAYEPWFKNDDPTNGEGYESAVAYAIAAELGFSADQVVWTVAPFNTVIAPGEKAFDFDINQVSITEERKAAVDFSSGYYDVKQALVTIAGSPIEGATTLAELKDAKLGAQIGTTSYAVIEDLIQPTQEIGSFDSNDVAKAALANGQIDGLIVDLPTAFYITAVELEDGLIVGQFETTSDTEQFGLVLNKDSVLTTCVSAAVDNLKADGTLAAIEAQWLSQVVSAPVIK
jgi:polar amino acid transport system substrate-binding protein